MDILAKLLGSSQRVKLLRLFLFNSEAVFEAKELSSRTKISTVHARRELNLFKSIKLVRSKIELRVGSRGKKKINGWQLNPNFVYTQPLRELLAAELFPDHQAVARRFARAGKIQALVIAGVFLRDPQGYVDLVIAGDNLNRSFIEKTIRTLEAEIGKELVYAILDSEDFLYRYHSSDRFIRDLLDHSHQFLIDKMNITD